MVAALVAPEIPRKDRSKSFLGYMLYKNRLWFDNDKYGLTIGGGQINNPGR